jgi:hypothetical protein
VEVWGAVAGGALAAYMVAVIADGCASIMVARSSSEALRFYPNNALVFTLVREMLARPGIDQVLFGMESFETYQGIDDFKMSMGFVRTPIHQEVVLHLLVRPALRSAWVGRVVARLADRHPDHELWRKLRGLTALASTAPGAPSPALR